MRVSKSSRHFLGEEEWQTGEAQTSLCSSFEDVLYHRSLFAFHIMHQRQCPCKGVDQTLIFLELLSYLTDRIMHFSFGKYLQPGLFPGTFTLLILTGGSMSLHEKVQYLRLTL